MTKTGGRRGWLALVVACFAAAQLSCASAGFTPEQHPMPAARAALQPEYRLFYDALADYGDWKLIEPYGYVFRPRGVGYDAWQPYNDGYWAPTDLYGWVWVSAEPFGWATYHYGRWFFDPYQGWVWAPGLDWAPAWVAWQGADDYVGWAPLGPDGGVSTRAPGGGFLFVRPGELTATNLRAQAVPATKLPPQVVEEAHAILNPGEAEGVEFNRGPRFDAIERVAGPLRLSKLDDILPADVVQQTRKSEADVRAPEVPGLMKRAAENAAREARTVRESKSETSPVRVPVLRPLSGKAWKEAAAQAKAGKSGAARDTTR